MSTTEIPAFTNIEAAVQVVRAMLEKEDAEPQRHSGEPWPAGSTITVPMAELPIADSPLGRRLAKAVRRALRELPGAAVEIADTCIRVVVDEAHDASAPFCESSHHSA